MLERMTWLGVVTAAAAISGVLAGWRMALLRGIGFLAMGVLGLWEASLLTLALMLLAVLGALIIGIPVGIWAGRSDRVEKILRPILDGDADDPRVLVPDPTGAAVQYRAGDRADRRP